MSRHDHDRVMLFGSDDESGREETPATTHPLRSIRALTKNTASKSSGKKSKRPIELTMDEDDMLANTFGGDDDDNDVADDQSVVDVKGKKRLATQPAAPSRPITAVLDEIDTELVRMKEDGVALKTIAQVLEEKFAVTYNSKSTHSRYLRIKEKIAGQKDEELALGLDTWHEGEDEALMCAYEKANESIEAEYDRLKSRRFTYTARYLAGLKGTVYSAKACQERYCALIDEEARPPPELDDKPEERAAEIAEARMRFIEEQARQEQEKAEAEEHARRISMKSRTAYHEKSKNAAEREVKRTMEKVERQKAQLAREEAKLETWKLREVKRTDNLHRISTGGDKRAGARLTKKQKDAKQQAALRKKVEDGSISASPAPRRSQPGMGAAATKSTRRAIITKKTAKKHNPGPFLDDSEDEYEPSEAGGSDVEARPASEKRRGARRSTRAITIDSDAEMEDEEGEDAVMESIRVGGKPGAA